MTHLLTHARASVRIYTRAPAALTPPRVDFPACKAEWRRRANIWARTGCVRKRHVGDTDGRLNAGAVCCVALATAAQVRASRVAASANSFISRHRLIMYTSQTRGRAERDAPRGSRRSGIAAESGSRNWLLRQSCQTPVPLTS